MRQGQVKCIRWPGRAPGVRSAPPREVRVAVRLAGVLLLAMACKDDAVDPFALAPCSQLPRETLSSVPPLSLPEITPALEDAVVRLARVLPEGRTRAELRATLDELASDIKQRDTVCRLFLLAWEALNELDRLDDPATRPDRTAIRLVLGLTCHCLRTTST